LAELVCTLLNGKLWFALGNLAALPRAAVVVEDRCSQVFKLGWVRAAVVADGLAELQVRWPDVPITFCETRQLAEEGLRRSRRRSGHDERGPSLGSCSRDGRGGPRPPQTGDLASVAEGPRVLASVHLSRGRRIRFWCCAGPCGIACSAHAIGDKARRDRRVTGSVQSKIRGRA
jgi:hypothetical protein